MAGPNTGVTGSAWGINNVDSQTHSVDGATPGISGPSASSAYAENKLYCRFDEESDPLEIIAAFDRAKVLMIEQLNKLGL